MMSLIPDRDGRPPVEWVVGSASIEFARWVTSFQCLPQIMSNRL